MSITIESNFIKENEKVNMGDKVKLAYKWHNGLTLAEGLQEITGDDTFEFIMNDDLNNYLFTNENNNNVVINNIGEVLDSDLKVNPLFVRLSQQRLLRTEDMIQAVWA